ncbi:hypothetical protein [Streptomyces lasalocidi]|uniref:Uncharacterized protein n=1 Tax=Streptomyces lasalocidi TaxID=324833 RepID=A0A4U5WBX8_STRLS|nr:hypothetical protein [Streptomyces lasalocidi]TKS98999.1 hypothetical protein E4U91_01890 [Streptomyces lasalocidi]
MEVLKRRLERSLAAQSLLAFVLALGITALFRRDEHPAVWVVHAAFYTAASVGAATWQRRRLARSVGTDTAGLSDLSRRIRRRDVPADPQERAAMRRLVAECLGKMERARRWLPYYLALLGLIGAGMLVLGAIQGSWVWPVVFALGVAGFSAGFLWMRRRSRERLRFMRDALRQEDARVS